jgi:hypothetical protein
MTNNSSQNPKSYNPVKSDKIQNRESIVAWIQQTIAALEARDSAALIEGLAAEVSFLWLGQQWQGREAVEAAISEQVAAWEAVRFQPVHILIEAEQGVAAVAWVCRFGREGAYQEMLGGTVLEFNEAGSLRYARTYLDPVRSRLIPHLELPWPEIGWQPCQEPGPPPERTVLEAVIQANARAWASHEVKQLSQILHDEITVCPPWDYLVGRRKVEKGAEVYFSHYRETQVTPHRLIIDPSQPYFGVCEQTFACTNPETGRRGEDADYAFFEVAKGKLRYWRTYFDTTRSVQVLEKTAGFLKGESGE